MPSSRAAWSLSVLALLSSCVARKAPGPAECRAVALESVGVRVSTPAEELERVRPELAARAEEITHQCLTVPWDYDVLRCLEAGETGGTCLRRFELRRRAGLDRY